jgi:hypothetical protein
LSDDGVVFNFGEVSTSGNFSRGIRVNNDGRIFNYGAITTSGNSSTAAVMNEEGSIFNFWFNNNNWKYFTWYFG